MGRKHEKKSTHIEYADERRNAEKKPASADAENENPPRTTTGGWFTTPKFGSSTSGGGETEPGPERD